MNQIYQLLNVNWRHTCFRNFKIYSIFSYTSMYFLYVNYIPCIMWYDFVTCIWYVLLSTYFYHFVTGYLYYLYCIHMQCSQYYYYFISITIILLSSSSLLLLLLLLLCRCRLVRPCRQLILNTDSHYHRQCIVDM